jgi:hypothetical protein
MKTLLTLIITALLISAAQAGEALEGVTPQSLMRPFMDLGFAFDKVEGKVGTVHMASDGTHTVLIEARGSEVRKVFASARPSKDTTMAKVFFYVLATQPFANKDRDLAFRWVGKNVGSNEQIEIGDTHFKFETVSGMCTLKITPIVRAIVPKSTARERYGDIKKPVYGMDYREAIAIFGEPLMKVEDWAIWSGFKARFLGGMVQEVAEIKASN